jgi:hypothetical protein
VAGRLRAGKADREDISRNHRETFIDRGTVAAARAGRDLSISPS